MMMKRSIYENYVKSDNLINLVGQATMAELIELIRHCHIFISADTGPLHIANALKKPLIALFNYGYHRIERAVWGQSCHHLLFPLPRESCT